jgi:hypothetical protein
MTLTRWLGSVALHVRRWATATVLILAAAAKGAAIFNGTPMFLGGWHVPMSLELALVACEWLFAATLAARWIPARLERIACLVLFASFTGIQGFRLGFASSSCGCFGSHDIPAVAMFFLDAIFLALWIPRRELHERRTAYPFLALPLLCIGLTAALRHEQLVTVISPSPDAIATSLPDGLSDLTTLTTGHWAVICYSDSCPLCQEELPHWIDAVQRRQRAAGNRRWAFVAIGDSNGKDLLAKTHLPPEIPVWHIHRASIDDLPCALVLDDGRVVVRWTNPRSVLNGTP